MSEHITVSRSGETIRVVTVGVRGPAGEAAEAGDVTSVNGETGDVTLTASDVGADAAGSAAAVAATAAAGDIAVAAAAASALASHASDATAIHGIADTADLATSASVAAAVTAHAGATDPHGDRAAASSALSTHEADTTNVHGIADTSALATTSGQTAAISAAIAALSSVYQPLAANLTVLAALVGAADRLPYFTGSGTMSLATFTSFGRTLAALADAAAGRTALGLGSLATESTVTSALITDGTIVNGDINGSAGIAGTKVDAGTETTRGTLELATDAEAETGTDTARAITPANAAAVYPKKSMLTTQGDMIYATAAGTWARLAKGTAFQRLRMNLAATAPEWVTVGELLATKVHDPASTTTYTTTSATLGDVDSTNLAVTFTAPASGNVLVKLEARITDNSAADLTWGLRNGSSKAGGLFVLGKSQNFSGGYQVRTGQVYVSGLTPGTSYTYKFAWAISGGVTFSLQAGQTAGSEGAASMMVFSA